jgi:argininosuccinate lyase
MMPHKRNPYLCEVVAAKMNSIMGKWNIAITTLSAAPYSNTAKATEVLSEIMDGLESTRCGLVLFSAILNGLHPNYKAMRETAEIHYTCSTALANELVTKVGYAFRKAHRLVGEWVSMAENQHQTFVEIVHSECLKLGINNINYDILLPDNAMLASEYGGGPGTMSMKKQIEQLIRKSELLKEGVSAHTKRWHAADDLLNEAVSRVCN